MDKKLLTTPQGFSKLRLELARLINEERPNVIEALKEARTYGGELSENAEYLEAKDRQDNVEKRIVDLQNKIENSKVINISEIADDGVARFGTIVTLVDLDDEQEKKLTYQIVGAEESDIKDGKISYLSPLGAAVINKKIGDVVYFRTPTSERELEILEVKIPQSK